MNDNESRDQIEKLTAKLHNSNELFWQKLRYAIAQHGLVPKETILADLFSEDTGVMVGVVVFKKHGYFFEFGDTHDMPHATITRWLLLDDISNLGPAIPSRDLLRVALQMSKS